MFVIVVFFGVVAFVVVVVGVCHLSRLERSWIAFETMINKQSEFAVTLLVLETMLCWAYVVVSGHSWCCRHANTVVVEQLCC